MKASILDLRRKTGDIIRALEQNETVTISYRGRKKGVIYPVKAAKETPEAIAEHPAFGMWRDRSDLEDVEKAIGVLRKGRFHDI
jgi:prevent-host-death family protein